MTEIFSHDISFCEDGEANGVYIISGKDWENGSFELYLREEDVKNLIWQMSYYISSDGV